MGNLEFETCADCAAKLGTPLLCTSCLHNRTAIYEQSIKIKALEAKLAEVHQLAIYASNAKSRNLYNAIILEVSEVEDDS